MATRAVVTVEKSGNVAVITLNRPEKRNALNYETEKELARIVASFRGDNQTRFIILTGAGSAFCAGVDFSREEATSRFSHGDVNSPRVWEMYGHDFNYALENMEQVTIAAINGHCMGAGLLLAMCCDFRISASDALLGIPETKLGVFFTRGSMPRLVTLVGPAKAKELIMTCDNIDAQEAHRIGLVNRVVSREALLPACREMIDKIAARGPLSIRMTKKIINAASVGKMADLFLCEPEMVERLYISGQTEEGARAFYEKRPPEYGK
jgi:enoyl-CoA hydratase/carnithine racemase